MNYGIITANVLSKNMRNKKTFKYALLLGVIVPVFAFSLAFAEQAENEEQPAKLERPVKSVDPKPAQQRANTRSEDSELKNSAFAQRQVRVAAILRLMDNQIDRASKAIDRLDKIMQRIQTRRDKLAEKEGVDLAKVDALIETAKKQKADAQEALRKAKADWEAFKNASGEDGDPRAAGKAFMASIRDLNKKLIAFHKSLNEVVQAMKRAEPKPEGQTRCDNLKDQELTRCRAASQEDN
jgi:hypothetical protein